MKILWLLCKYKAFRFDVKNQTFWIWRFFSWKFLGYLVKSKQTLRFDGKKIQILEFKYFFLISGTKILWDRFKALARLEKKYDETLLEFYLAFMATCKKAANVDLNEDEESSSLSIEAIDESKAKKILARVELFKSMREEVKKSSNCNVCFDFTK